MGRTFRFNDRFFQGFNKDFSTRHRLVLVQDEDVVEAWAIDGIDIVEEIDELLRFFTASQSQSKIIGTYSEEGFRGFKCAEKFVANSSRFKKDS